MILKDYKIDGDKVTLSKKELEEWATHYLEVAKKHTNGKLGYMYVGRRDSIIDILKLFDNNMEQLAP